LLSGFRALQSQRDSFVLNCVANSSRQTYSTGIKRWHQFVEFIGTNPVLSRIPPEWHAINQMRDVIPRPWREDCITTFLTWLRCDPRPVVPKTAFGYLSAVRFYLVNARVDVSFLSSTFIRSTKLGMVNVWRLQPGNTVADRRALPLSINMILGTRNAFRSPLSLQDLTTFTAMILVTARLPASPSTYQSLVTFGRTLFYRITSYSPFGGETFLFLLHLTPYATSLSRMFWVVW
jgi:hypothetical protein